MSTNPTGGSSAWTLESTPFPVAGLSCLTASRCIAAGNESIADVSIAPASLAPRIKASLRAQLTNLARHRHGSRRFAVKAITAGKLRITWYRKHVVIASGAITFNLAGTRTIALRLTRAGERALARTRSLRVTAVAAFTRPGGSTVGVSRPLTS